MLPRGKLNSIESKISEASINEISHEVFMTVINKGRNYPELKESQRVEIEKANLLEEDKEIGIDEIIKCNKIKITI